MRFVGALFALLLVTQSAWGEIVFPKARLSFAGGVKLSVEVAKTEAERAQGLMLRTQLPEGKGMLFEFRSEEYLSFWMKNTLIPLSIGFFDRNKKLLEVLDMEPVIGPVADASLPRYQSRQPAMYALEVPKGWFTKHKIKPPAQFQLSR